MTVSANGYQSIQLDPFFNYTGTNTQGLAEAIFSCNSCSNFTFGPGNIINSTTGSGLQIFGNSTNGTVIGNLIYDIGAYGIMLGTSPQNSDTNATVTNNITVTNNRVAGTSNSFRQAMGSCSGTFTIST